MYMIKCVKKQLEMYIKLESCKIHVTLRNCENSKVHHYKHQVDSLQHMWSCFSLQERGGGGGGGRAREVDEG